MININLIKERKAVAVKAQRKKSAGSSGVQENIIIIVFGLLAIGGAFFRNMMISNELEAETNTLNQKKAEYAKLEKYKDQQLDYEIRKELLNEKIIKIGELKDRREGPVKLLEDVYNNLPPSVYLEEIAQGVDKRLLAKMDKNSDTFKVGGERLGKPNQIMVTGVSRTIDGASTFANRIQSIERYSDINLNTVQSINESQTEEFRFALLFVTQLEDKDDPTAKKNAR